MTVALAPALTSPARLTPAPLMCVSAACGSALVCPCSFVPLRPCPPGKYTLNRRETTNPWCLIKFPYQGYKAPGIVTSIFTFTSISEIIENIRAVFSLDCFGVNLRSAAPLATVDIALPKQ